MAKMIVAGGGMCGMAAAMMLADDGHDVTVIERDLEPPPPDVGHAFGDWNRRSVRQFGQGHWLHARGTTILREALPGVYRRLADNGGYRFNLVTYLLGLMPDAAPEPGDDRFDLVTGRRSTMEWAMASEAQDHPGVSIRRGAPIAGLVAESERAGAPRVTGVRLEDGERLDADLVIDATGRRSPTMSWLADIGAAVPQEQTNENGFVYYGRYFSSPDGSVPPVLGPILAAYGSFSILTLPADNGTWSVTLYGLSSDKPLRSFRDVEVADRVIRSLPRHAHWLDGEQITEIHTMAGAVDRHRQFVVGGSPVVTGLLTVGDASSCTNPSLGRGISLGLMHVEVMRACVADHGDDLDSLAKAFHERTEQEIRPWHDDTVAIDNRRVDDMKTFRSGGTPEPTPEQRIADTLGAGVTVDPSVTRAFGEIFSCLTRGADVMARPGMLEHVIGLADKVSLDPLPGPDREQLLELVS